MCAQIADAASRFQWERRSWFASCSDGFGVGGGKICTAGGEVAFVALSIVCSNIMSSGSDFDTG